MMKFYNNTTWVNMTGGGGGGYWTQSGTDIRNTNTGGNVNVTDVCTEGGVCLSAGAQVNVIAGPSKPECPTGQDILMKAYNGIWYTGNNGNITTYNEVVCGKVISPDGTSYLVNGHHTTKQCTDTIVNGTRGELFYDAAGWQACRFSGASCPTGSPNWMTYNNWSTLGNITAYSPAGCGAAANKCTTTGGARPWGTASPVTQWARVYIYCGTRGFGTCTNCDCPGNCWGTLAFTEVLCDNSSTSVADTSASCSGCWCSGCSVAVCANPGSATPPITQIGCY
jgi:hypothetical protein